MQNRSGAFVPVNFWKDMMDIPAFPLVDAAGRALFVGEGPLSKPQIAELEARLDELGCDAK